MLPKVRIDIRGHFFSVISEQSVSVISYQLSVSSQQETDLYLVPCISWLTTNLN